MADTITNMSLLDWLDDLTVRFLLNLPASELSSVPRLCFQVEEAQWFYEDFIRPIAAAAGNPLPSLSLRQFCLQLFQHCPLLSGFTDAQHIAAYEEFLAYKVRVPVRGAILMDESMEKLVLVKGWKKGASWSFPRGKINKDEKDLDCAIREVYEETGYDIIKAGLVPEAGEHGAKYIDVTMREQHMRLFVFKGVPEDTYFEPQTRKEISKIAWYNVRDLPGFKKSKQGADQTNYANKFYMVAPFLGQLKRWINEQRRQDAPQDAPLTTPGGDAEVAQAGNEEEEMETATQVPESIVIDKAEELRRLLSIGAPTTPSAPQPPPATANGQSSNLLALLQGAPKPAASVPPRTPLEQIHAFPQEPQSPHPRHPRHPSMGYQQAAPQFPFSPQMLQQQLHPQQRIFSVPAPGPFQPGPNGFQSQQQQGFPQLPPTHMHPQQFQQQRQSMPAGSMPRPGSMSGQQHNGVPFGMPQRQPRQPPQMPPPTALPQQQQQQQFPRPSDAVLAQGPGAIEAGPAVPNAENLPMPHLNPHSMNLLNTFKTGHKSTASSGMASNAPPRQASQHQAALLNLFGKPSAAQTVLTPAAAAAVKAREASSPTLSDVTERPARAQERRPTLNEITRTLPAKLKVNSPSPAPEMPSRELPMQAAIPSEAQAERSQSRQLYDPAHPKQFVRAAPEAVKPAQGARDPQVKILQRPPPPQPMPRSPKPPVGRSPKAKHASPARQSAAPRGAENGTPTTLPGFTILARPGSSAGAAKAPAPAALPRQQQRQQREHVAPMVSGGGEAARPPAFQPRVLKRPESVDPGMVQKAAAVVETRGSEGGDKREQLLSLFGRTPVTSPPPPAVEMPAPAPPAPPDARKNDILNRFTGAPESAAAASPPRLPAQSVTPASQPAEADTRKYNLLGLLGGAQQSGAAAAAATAAATPAPPSAPHIQPERRPSSQGIAHHQRQQTPHNALLDLFTRPSSSATLHHHNNNNSPGTPISPFTLGTPATRVAPQLLAAALGQVVGPEHAVVPKSRLNSVATATATAAEEGGRRGSGAGTPAAEASKGFLLDYLNGVVRMEGHRGARRG
ncbi:hypothetical protein LTR36_008366 [Oleoguttula mirabilis]|uniref:Nudix hydrolase domain-containing protein n=1 Tax=Oleoguttula mirabilis TaxID=1507867 RepID=A0AAV9J7L8_9PEZI|nr:hypothetical protein LTR36_008366 [Oleoguttula mirabilis]